MVMMLGWKNWLDAEDFTSATITGGSYAAAYPATNLRTRRLIQAARTTDATTGSTYGVIDLGQSRTWRFLSFVGNNLTSSATIRVRGASSEAALTSSPTFDQTFDAWVSPNTPTSTDGNKPTAVCLASADQTTRWLRFDITDTSNPDGVVEIEHLGVWQGYTPPHQYDIGARTGVESYSAVDESVGLAEYFFVRGNGRAKQFGISFVDDDAADAWQDIQRYCDIHRPCFFLHDAAEPARWIRRSYLCRLRVLSSIEYPQPTWRTIGAEVKEWLA